ncbi:FmdB family zinc ribbon protein [Caldicellulosiruptoraceae bacterium PP1]
MFYSFICNKCNSNFEIRASISQMTAGLRVICPNCSSEDVSRDYSTISFGVSSGNNSSTSSSCSGCSGGKGCCN